MMFAYEGGVFQEGSAAPVWLILLGLLGSSLPRLRSGIGHLGLHLRDLPEPRARAWPVAGLAHALGVRVHHHVRFPVLTDKLGGGFAFGIFFLAMVGQLFWS